MERTEFNLVLQPVDLERKSEIRRELARLFAIDEEIAGDIIGAAPIILLADLTLGAGGVVRARLEALEERGARVVLTNAACDDIPKVNWPEDPQVARVSAAEAAGRAPSWREVASFRCPTCGEGMKLVRAREEAPAARAAEAPPQPAVELSRQRERVDSGPSPQGEGTARPSAPPLPPVRLAQEAPEPFSSERQAVIPAGPRKSSAAIPAAPSPERATTLEPAKPRAEPPPAVVLPAQAAAPPPQPAPAVDPGPLVRAFEAARERRESARLPPTQPALPVQGDARPPRSPPSKLANEDTDAFDRFELDSIAASTAAAPPPPKPAPTPPPPPAARVAPAPAPEPVEDFGTFDIDEALRLLDNAPDAPAPAGTAAAPPPLPLPPQPRARERDLPFDEIESDIADLEAALEPPAPPAKFAGGTPAARLSVPAARAPEPRPAAKPAPPKREDFLSPLDPFEALSILESVKAPTSDDEVFSKPPVEPVSDELEPLDPNEAMSLLETSQPAARAAAPAQRAPAPPPPRPAKPVSSPSHPALPAARPPQKPAPPPPARIPSGGYKAEVPLERIALTAADLADSNDELPLVEPPPAPERSPAQRSLANMKTGAFNPAQKRPSGERAAAVKRTTREPGSEEPVHGLVLSKITGDGKRQKAAELIAEIAKVSRDEALKLTDRTIIPVLKGVTKEEAESALARFQRSRISGRVTTRRLGE